MSADRKTLTKLSYACALASVALVASTLIVFVLFSFQHQEMRGYITQVAFWVTLVVSLPICIYESNQHFNLQRARDRLAEQGRQLADARDEALRAHKAKSQFLAKMSHEIRTPMNGVVGLASLLREVVTDRRQREMVDVIVTSGDSLVRLIDDILDFSRLEAGKMQFERKPFDVAETLEDVAALIALPAWKKGLTLNVWRDPDIPTVIIGDAGRVRQIIVNLVGNAVKFTERGSIDLTLDGVVEGAQLAMSIAIKDTGCGIPADKLSAIFERFEQVDNSLARRHGGAGLGLAITKELAQAMGGSISVASRIGVGSTFCVKLTAPLDLDARSRIPTLADRRIGVALGDADAQRTASRYLQSAGAQIDAVDISARERWIEAPPFDAVVVDANALESEGTWPGAPPMVLVVEPDVSTLTGATARMQISRPIRRRALIEAVEAAISARPEHSAPPHAEEEPLGAHVLVAEDNAVNQMVIGAMLEKLGCTFQFVSDGMAAAEAAKDGFDVILMDISMPRLSGEDAARLIRAREAAGKFRTPIVAVTAHAAARLDVLNEAGIDDVLVKPIRLDRLGAMIDKWTAQRSARTPGRVAWKS